MVPCLAVHAQSAMDRGEGSIFAAGVMVQVVASLSVGTARGQAPNEQHIYIIDN